METIILADCGSEIGLGHLRRCLVLATALAGQGAICRVMTPESNGAEFAFAAGFEVEPWPENLAALPLAELLVADSYRLPVETMRGWSGLFSCRVLIDDLADRRIDADLVLNGNLFAAGLAYAAPALLGPDYALIDPAFFAQRGQERALRRRALIAFGGTDDGHIGGAVAASLLALDGQLRADVVISPLHAEPHLPDGLSRDRLKLHHGADMVALMGQASLYIGAAGSTVLEAAAASLPMVVAALGENQRMNIQALRALGVTAFDAIDPAAMAEAAGAALRQSDVSLQALVQPGGAERAADAIRAHMTKQGNGA